MGSVRGKMSKGGYKKHRSKRPQGISRNGLPKIYPPSISTTVRQTVK